jgi:hypothetical protein
MGSWCLVSTYGTATALASEAAAEIVDDDICASRGKEEGICSAKTTAGAGDDHGLAIPSQFIGHVCGCGEDYDEVDVGGGGGGEGGGGEGGGEWRRLEEKKKEKEEEEEEDDDDEDETVRLQSATA